MKKFFTHRLYYFIPPSLKDRLDPLRRDLEEVAPHTEIIPVVIDTKSDFSPQAFAENYLFFDEFFSSFPFCDEEEDYYIHFGPGNMFAHSFMLMMLVNWASRLPLRSPAANLLYTSVISSGMKLAAVHTPPTAPWHRLA